MVYCALCKQTKDPKYNWVIYETGAGGLVKKYRVCDDCAVHLLKETSKDVLGLRDNETLQLPMELTKVGVIDGLHLLENGDVEIALKVDFSQAKRIIEKKLEAEALEGISDK